MSEFTRLDEAADWLQRLRSAPQDEILAGAWAEWCQADPENVAAFERLEALWGALDAPQVRALLPSDTITRVAPSRSSRRGSAMLALAASVALGVLGAFWWLSAHQTAANVLTTNVAEHGSQILADGSHVDLGARTRILTRYTSSERSITVESGEAFFDVAKDSARPFIVSAGKVQVTALGTAFSVRRSRDRTVVTVSEGTVRIAPDSDGKTAHQIQAGAGEQATFVESTHNLSLARVDPKNATAWRDGILKFVDEPLSAVVDDVNRYSRREIVIEDPALRDRLYTGTIYRDRIEDWLRALQEVFPLEPVERADQIALIEKKR